MAWSVLQSCSGVSSATATATFTTANLSSGSKLIAYVTAASQTCTAVKDGSSNAFTKLLTATNGSYNLYVWEMDTPAGDVGTKPTITPTLSGTAGGSGILVQEVSGLLTGSSCLDGTAGSTNGNTTFSNAGTSVSLGAYTSAVASEYLIIVEGDSGDGSGCKITTPSGYTADSNNVFNNGNDDLSAFWKNSTGGTEAPTTITATAVSSGSFQYGTEFVAFKLAAAGTPVTYQPIVVTRSQHRKGTVFLRKTPPVFTAPTQKPIAKTFVRRNKGQVFLRPTPPVFTPQNEHPIVRTVSKHRPGVRSLLPLPPPPIVATREPIVVTTSKHRKGVLFLRPTPPVFTAPNQYPIVRTFVRRNHGRAYLLELTPQPAVVAVETQLPIVRTFKRKNPGAIKVLHQLPVFTAPNQYPLVRSFVRRNRGVAHLLTFPPLQTVATPAPIVRTFKRRNRGQVQILHELPVFTAPTQRPLVVTKALHRKGVITLPPRQPPPPFTIGILATDTYTAGVATYWDSSKWDSAQWDSGSYGDLESNTVTVAIETDIYPAGPATYWDQSNWDTSVWDSAETGVLDVTTETVMFLSKTSAVAEDVTTEG